MPPIPIQTWLYGRHVFMGYLNDEEKTNTTKNETLDTRIDSDGWLHSGDIGEIKVGIITVVDNVLDVFTNARETGLVRLTSHAHVQSKVKVSVLFVC